MANEAKKLVRYILVTADGEREISETEAVKLNGDAFADGRALGHTDVLLNIQNFFTMYADSIKPVHASEDRRAFVRELLLRAEEAKLYHPEAK